MNTKEIIEQTRCWVESVVIGCGFCPFAKREFENNRIRYVVNDVKDIENNLLRFVDECLFLDANDEVETTLIILSEGFKKFDAFLDLVDMSEQLLDKQGYIGVYQIASFHPEYIFAESNNLDAANYTNRSPYPMLHLLREKSIENALARHPDPDSIPERNIVFARKEGLDNMKDRLNDCCNKLSSKP